MSEHELTIGKAAALAAPAAAGSGASVTLLGMNAEQWAIVASVATVAYTMVLFYSLMPRLVGLTRSYWHKLFPPKPANDDDTAGA